MATLDFSGFLSAVQSLIDAKIQSSQYSLVQDATITGKNGSSYTITSGDNSYSAIPIDGASEYPLNSLVCVLVTNNTKAGVVNYILGLKDAEAGKDYSHLLTKIVVELSGNVTNGNNEFTLKMGENVNTLYSKNKSINKIGLETKDDFRAYVREHGVLKIKAIFSTSFSPNDIGKVEYGLAFTLGFKNGITKTYKVSNFDMVGDPYDFTSSEQEIIFKIEEEYKQNFFYIDKIVFYSEGDLSEETSIQMQNLSIFASEIQGLINDLKVNLKLASLESSFLGDSNKVTLQAQLTNDSGGVFNFGKMRYFWFLKDATITHESEGFSNIAGAGWTCLNEKQPYTLDGVTYPNWIGTTDSLFELTEDMAPERNNFYRCYAIYDGNVSLSKHLVSNDIKIINYNKVEFILTLNADKYNFETLEDTITLSAEVTGTPQPKEGYIYDYEYKWLDNNAELADSSSIEVQPKDKTPIQTYSCEVKCYLKKDNETVNDKILLSTVTKEISLNNLVADGELVTETVYYWKNTTSAPSAPQEYAVYDEKDTDWNPIQDNNKGSNKYRFKSTRQVLLTTYGDDEDKIWAGYEKDESGEFYLHYNETAKIYYYSKIKGSTDEKYSFNLKQMEKNPLNWSEPECDFIVGAYDSITAAAQLNIFNQLTENGKQDGIYYSEKDPLGYQPTADTTVNPDKTYYTKEGNTYVIVEEPVENPNDAGYYEYTNKLYINATYIKTGTLLVEDSGGTIFKASVNEKTVSIGGWEVDSHNIFSNHKSANSGLPKVGISSSGDYAFWAGVTQWSNGSPNLSSALFRVGFDGKLYSTAGKIGGWVIDTSILYISKKNGDKYIGSGLSATATSTDPAFWAGYEGENANDTNPWYSDDSEKLGWGAKTNFYVTHEGAIYAKKGEIAGLKINEIEVTKPGQANLTLTSLLAYQNNDDETLFALTSEGDIYLAGNISVDNGFFKKGYCESLFESYSGFKINSSGNIDASLSYKSNGDYIIFDCYDTRDTDISAPVYYNSTVSMLVSSCIVKWYPVSDTNYNTLISINEKEYYKSGSPVGSSYKPKSYHLVIKNDSHQFINKDTGGEDTNNRPYGHGLSHILGAFAYLERTDKLAAKGTLDFPCLLETYINGKNVYVYNDITTENSKYKLCVYIYGY